MVTDEKLAAYLAGEMDDKDRASFEAEVLADEAARRELLAHRKISAGLHALLGDDHEPLSRAILATTRGLSDEAMKQRVMARPVRRINAFPASAGRPVFRRVLALAALVMLLRERRMDVAAESARGARRLDGGGGLGWQGLEARRGAAARFAESG